jgi:uncharacterized protein
VLYAVCGLLMTPLLRYRPGALLGLGAAAIAATCLVALAAPPSGEALRVHIEHATQIYGRDGFAGILVFRLYETRFFMLPVGLAIMPKTVGLMLCGVAAWRLGLLRDPERHRVLLRKILSGTGWIGGTLTVLKVYLESFGHLGDVLSMLLGVASSVPLAFAYAAGLLLWWNSGKRQASPALAAIGRMALTNYLLQSVVLGFIFYGYGLGLFGRLGSAAAALAGILIYAGQLAFSRLWLERFRFGPFEWLWRSMTYGQWQSMAHRQVTRPPEFEPTWFTLR